MKIRSILSWFVLKLAVGNFALSHDQERLHMAMWSMLAAPLLMSNDLRTIRRSSKAILLNRNVIAINQDPLGKQGQKVMQVTNCCIHASTSMMLGWVAEAAE